MRCRRLTETSRIEQEADGAPRLVSAYEWHGQAVEVCDSARNVLELIALFAAERLDPWEKDARLRAMLFFDPEAAEAIAGSDFRELVEDVLWDVCGLDVTEGSTHSEDHEDPAFDWDEDADRIRASLLSAYGINWDEAADTCSFAHILSLLSALMESGESPLQQAIAYRVSDPPKRVKGNDDYVDAWVARQEHFALKGADPSSAQNDAMADIFAAAERAAKEVR